MRLGKKNCIILYFVLSRMNILTYRIQVVILINGKFCFFLRNVDYHEKERASILMAAFLGIGITVGALTGMLLVKSI